MVINGFQKMTLLDYPGRVACTLFTAGCNLRCPFCHNAALVTEIRPEDRLDESEILAFLARRKGLLEGVAVTGGEPLLQPGIEDFLARIRDLGYPVKLDTNGSFPEKLASAAERGLVNYVAMDLKNRPEKYALTSSLQRAAIPKNWTNSASSASMRPRTTSRRSVSRTSSFLLSVLSRPAMFWRRSEAI